MIPPGFLARGRVRMRGANRDAAAAGVEFGPLVVGSEDEWQLQRVVIEVHGPLHVADVDRGVPTSDHGASVLLVAIYDKEQPEGLNRPEVGEYASAGEAV